MVENLIERLTGNSANFGSTCVQLFFKITEIGRFLILRICQTRQTQNKTVAHFGRGLVGKSNGQQMAVDIKNLAMLPPVAAKTPFAILLYAQQQFKIHFCQTVGLA